MKIKRALYSFFLVTVLYLSVILWTDSKNEVFSNISDLASVLIVMIGASFASFIVRYSRWQWLLVRAGYSPPILLGFLAYLSGFAFTATPGKVGELMRIRYFLPMGIPSWVTLAAFVFERSFDLLSVLLLSSFLCFHQTALFVFVSCFVFVFIFSISSLIIKPKLISRILIFLKRWNMKRLIRLLRTLRKGFIGCRIWANPRDLAISFLLGISAWALISLSFIYFLNKLGFNFPILESLSVYPIAMLAGAASMIPGGLGSTEGVIIALLHAWHVALTAATLAAVAIRLSTLWFSIICGVFSVLILEIKQRF